MGGGALFSAGLLLGLIVRRDAPLQPRPAPKPPPAAAREELPQPPAALLEEVGRAARFQNLDADVEPASRTSTKGELTPTTLDELLKAYINLLGDRHPDPEKNRLLFAWLGQLNEQSATYFIQRFLKSNGPGLEEDRDASMQLALACGGPAVADFLNTLLNDSSLDSNLRGNLLSELSGAGGPMFSIRRLPISGALAATAMTMCRSEDHKDRRAAAGLLGGIRTEVSRLELRRLVDEDKDDQVRTTAVVSLGHVGDPGTRMYLERLWRLEDLSGRFRDAVEAAIKELSDASR